MSLFKAKTFFFFCLIRTVKLESIPAASLAPFTTIFISSKLLRTGNPQPKPCEVLKLLGDTVPIV